MESEDDDYEENSNRRIYLEKNEREELLEIFEIMKNENSEVDTNELVKGFEMMKFDRKMPRIYDIIVSLKDYGDFISKKEFFLAISENVGHKQTEEGKTKLFQTMCKKDSDKMDHSDYKELVSKSGDTIKDSEIEEMIRHFSNEKDHVDLNDFSLIMKRKFIGYH